MGSKLVPAWDTRTGEKRTVPEKWFDFEEMSANLSRTDPGIPHIAPAGADSVTHPDARDYDEAPADKPRRFARGGPNSAPKDSTTGDNTDPSPSGGDN